MKKTILTIIQIIVTVGILFWVFHDPKRVHQMAEALEQAFHRPGGLAWLLAGFGCYGLVEFLAAFRWFILLRVQGVNLAPWRVGALLMLGIFFNTFMPGATGGDVVKIFYLFKETPGKGGKGLLAVLMDRLIGLLALIIISSTIIGIQYKWLVTQPVSRSLTWVMLLILVCSLGGIVFSFLISGFHLAHKLPARMPMRDKLIDLSVAYNAYARAWPSSLAALTASFAIHFASFTLYICAAKALNLTVPIAQLYTVLPIILTLASMPISVGGTGVREGLFAALLGPLCGISQPVAFTLSLTGFILTAGWGMIGGVIYLFYRPADHARLREVEQKVHEVEHEIAETEEPGGGDRAVGQPEDDPANPEAPKLRSGR